ncbi:MAG TPA: DUF885 domain-containing protein [Candidatus Acidoferrales bacterium]|nr:DUF885 domain-containing protein [Candidatus Acidoferrales bacterium]
MRSMFFKAILGLSIVTVLIAGARLAKVMAAGRAQSADLEARRQSLNAVTSEEWEFVMRENPVFASQIGDYRYNDKLADNSPAAVVRRGKQFKEFLDRLDKIDVSGFPEQEKLSRTLLQRQLQWLLEDIAFKNYEMPFDQFNGFHLELAEMPPNVPVDSVKHFEDYVTRLHEIPAALDRAVEAARLGEADHLMQPKFLLERAADQCDSIATPAGEQNAFASPLKSIPSTFSAEDRTRIHDEIVKAIDTEVRPAYVRLGKFIREEYAPHGRTEPGLWSLPDGDARYREDVRHRTTTDMAPEQIHELGLAQVKEIEEQMNAIAKQQGYADWKAYGVAIRRDPKMMASSREQVLDTYRKFIAQMLPKLPELFGVLPKARLEVVPVETFREKEAAGAEYQQGTPDGLRPGRVYVNTGDFEHRSLPEMESTAYHEGVPGHHLQGSIAQEMTDLPAFRRHTYYNAYGEGWALYAERLGKEVGFYQQPANDFERLGSELFRAARLVEDTGVHYKHWTREQMVKYFEENSLEEGADLQAEVDRYIAWPGQALSYKIGQLKFLELRERAKKELGGKYDIRAFHDEMIDGGAMPLDVLDERTNEWIAKVKAGQ